MMHGDEMAQAAGAAPPEDNLAGSLRLIDAGPRGALPPLRIDQSTRARSGAVDRLAQLARLIEQDKTLAAIVRESRSDGGLDLSRPAEKPPVFQLARADKEIEHNREDEPPSAPVDRGLCDGAAGEPPDPPEYGEYDLPDYSNGLPDERRGLKVFAALAGLALAGSAGAVAFWALPDGRGRSGEAQVVAAAISPDQAAPSPREHGGLDERPDAPSDEPSVTATAQTATGAQESTDAKPPIPQVLPLTGIAIGPGPTKMAGLIPPPTPSESPAGTAQTQPPDMKKAPPRQIARGATEPRGARGLLYVVQLSSERSEAAAHTRSQVLQTKYPNAFAGRKPFICRAELGDRGVYYRVQMGPFAMGEANEICGNLKKSGADCVVQRN